jgi:hypothetical protein
MPSGQHKAFPLSLATFFFVGPFLFTDHSAMATPIPSSCDTMDSSDRIAPERAADVVDLSLSSASCLRTDGLASH